MDEQIRGFYAGVSAASTAYEKLHDQCARAEVRVDELEQRAREADAELAALGRVIAELHRVDERRGLALRSAAAGLDAVAKELEEAWSR